MKIYLVLLLVMVAILNISAAKVGRCDGQNIVICNASLRDADSLIRHSIVSLANGKRHLYHGRVMLFENGQTKHDDVVMKSGVHSLNMHHFLGLNDATLKGHVSVNYAGGPTSIYGFEPQLMELAFKAPASNGVYLYGFNNLLDGNLKLELTTENDQVNVHTFDSYMIKNLELGNVHFPDLKIKVMNASFQRKKNVVLEDIVQASVIIDGIYLKGAQESGALVRGGEKAALTLTRSVDRHFHHSEFTAEELSHCSQTLYIGVEYEAVIEIPESDPAGAEIISIRSKIAC